MANEEFERGPFAAAAFAWILLLVVAILAVIVSARLWSSWVRSRPPT